MSYCSNCGNKIEDSDKFCSKCGEKVGEPEKTKKIERVPYAEQGANEEEIRDLEKELGESILFSFSGHTCDTSGKFFLTQKFIFMKLGMIKKSTRKIPYKTITSVKLKDGILQSEITLFGQHLQEKSEAKPRYGSMGILQLESESGLRIKNIDKKDAKKATEIIENIIY